MRILRFPAFVIILLVANSAIAAAPLTYPDDDPPLRTPQTEFDLGDLPATTNSLFPGTKATPTPSNNIITVKSGTIGGHVYGGIAPTTGVSSNNNIVEITGGAIGSSTAGGNVTGGWSLNYEASRNEVDISGGAIVNGIIYGGWLRGGGSYSSIIGANDNTITVGSGTYRNNIYGGYIQGSGGTVSNNTVNLNAGANITLTGSSTNIIAGGYSAMGVNNVEDNKVVIDGATINRTGVSIYGGRAFAAGSTVSGNSVTILDGTINGTTRGGTIYGGYSDSASTVTSNSVTIEGGTVNVAAIYGGYSNSTTQNSGSATNNSVTINTDANLGAGPDLYGGFVAGALGGNAFDGNELLLKGSGSNITVGNIRNFETITFDYTGILNAGTLYTTPTGSTKAGTTVDVGNHNINFNGAIAGSGSLTKTGTGILTLTQASQFAGLNIEQGTISFSNQNQLKMTNGGVITLNGNATLQFNGNINLNEKIVLDSATPLWGYFDVTTGNTVTIHGTIDGTNTGIRKIGSGTLILNNAVELTAGNVRIDGGTLQFGNGGTSGTLTTDPSGYRVGAINLPVVGTTLAYNHSDDVVVSEWIRSIGGTGGSTLVAGGKVVQRGTGTLTLTNTANEFNGGTEIERGTLRIVDNQSYNWARSLTTHAGYITFTENLGVNKNVIVDFPSNTPPSNRALTNSFRTKDGAGNNNFVDLATGTQISHVAIADDGGAFYVDQNTSMTVKANTLMLANNFANGKKNDLYVEDTGIFNLLADGAIAFGSGIGGKGTLNIKAADRSGRVVLGNVPSAPVAGDYDIGTTNITGTAGHQIGLSLNKVTFRHSDSFNMTGDKTLGSAILLDDGTIQATNIINIANTLLSPDNWNTPSRIPGTLTLDAPEINLDNFVMLYSAVGPQAILSGNTSNNSLLNLVGDDVTISGGTIVLSTIDTQTFTPGNYLIIRTDKGINNFADPNNYLSLQVEGFTLESGSGPRAHFGFVLGSDPIGIGPVPNANENNVWLSMSQLNSLTMEWDTLSHDVWENHDQFNSLQGNGVEHNFLPGDKVHITGKVSQSIDLPDGYFSNITVSGLVVGQSMSGVNGDENTTFTGAGGITANANSAFGEYVNKGTPDELSPTGLLEKYGNGTLTFLNTGGNNFMDGIEIHGGTIAFNQANQLNDGGNGITFKGDATLRALDNVALHNDIFIDPGKTASLDVVAGKVLEYDGAIDGDITTFLIKSGAGTLKLDAPTIFYGETTVSEGTLTLGNPNALQNSDVIVGSGSTLNVLRIAGASTTMESLKLQNGSFLQVQLYKGDNNTGNPVLNLNNDGIIESGAALIADFGRERLDNTPIEIYLFNTVAPDNKFDNNLVFVNILGRIIVEEKKRGSGDEELWLVMSGKPYGEIDNDLLRPNAKPIPDVLDKLQNNSDPNPLTDALGSIQGDAELAAVLNILPGDIFASGQLAASDLRKSFNGLLPTCQNIYGEYVTPMTDSYRGQCSTTRANRNSYWATPTGRWMQRTARDGYYGDDLGNVGIAVGMSHQVDRRNHIGVAFGYDYADLALQGLSQRDHFNAFNLALYGGYVDACQFADYQIGYGKNFHDTRRVISFPGFFAAPAVDYDDNLFSLSLMYGRKYGAFLPSIGLEYVQVWTPNFAEAGTSGAELRGIKSDYTSLELPVGFRLNKTFRAPVALLTPELRAFWVPQIGDQSSSVTTAFTAGGPTSPEFLVDTGDYGWQHFRAGTGVTARFNRNWSSSLNYDAALYSGSTRQTASLAVTATF